MLVILAGDGVIMILRDIFSYLQIFLNFLLNFIRPF